MDSRWTPFAKDSTRAVAVLRHPTASFVDILSGVATDGIDLSSYVTSAKHTSRDADVTFNYQTQLNATAQPRPGELLELQLQGMTLWVGIIDTISAYNLQHGTRTLSIKAYTRDNMPAWKDFKRVTSLYAAGTPVNQIASDIASSVGLTPAEIAIPLTSTYTVHSNLQLSNMAAWEMLKGALLSSGMDPFIDARGVLKGIYRDLSRVPDVVLTQDRIIAINGSKVRSPVTSVRILWLDPNLSEVIHQDQVLGTATITAGFFQLHQNLDIYFSADHTQRAKGTYMVIKQSANSGLLPVCSENYIVFDPFHGQIQLTTAMWAPALATLSLAEILAYSYDPDLVTALFGGITIPQGRIIQATAEIAVLLIMMSIGTGMYEIRGVPYDLVNARNRTEATASGVQDWLLQGVDIENDFVMNEQHAQAFAARELIYAARSAQSYSATIVDDPRIEPGDIISLYDGSALYVQDYSRTLTHGSPAVLTVKGFECSAVGATLIGAIGTTGHSIPGATPPPGALALGYTKLLWQIAPQVSDVSLTSTPLTALYGGPSASLSNAGGALTLTYDGVHGAAVSTQRQNSTGTAGTLAHLQVSTGFYVQCKFKLSTNNADHFPAFYLEPSSHFSVTDQLVGAPAGFEAWMEIDVVEAGFAPGPLSTVINWRGYFNQAVTFTVPPTGTSGTVASWPGLTGSFPLTFSTGQRKTVNLIQGSGTLATWTGALTGTPTVNATASYENTDYNNYGALGAIDWTQLHVFGVSVDPIGKRVQNWVDGVATFAKDISSFPAQFLTDNYFAIVDVVSHGAHIPYSLTISSIEAWGPP
jgi:hypothetical protein